MGRLIGLSCWQKNIPHAKVIGLDFSSEMLKIAQTKVAASNLTNIELLSGNAMDLNFKDQNFDVVTIGFGLRNVPDANQVLNEIFRILKPKGQLICLEAFKVQTPVVKLGWEMYFNHLMPMMGKVFAKSKPEYQYLDDSVNMFVSIKQLAQMMQDVGFDDIEVKDLMLKAAAIHSARK